MTIAWMLVPSDEDDIGGFAIPKSSNAAYFFAYISILLLSKFPSDQ